MYKNETFLGTLGYFEKLRMAPRKDLYVKFNSVAGQIALRAVDGVNPDKPISFMKPSELDYDVSGIKESSRLITFIELDTENRFVDVLIESSNNLLSKFRAKTHDILLSPFKGNKNNGERRRRLDYSTARAILEDAFYAVNPSLRLL